jgi:hypothetical protein
MNFPGHTWYRPLATDAAPNIPEAPTKHPKTALHRCRATGSPDHGRVALCWPRRRVARQHRSIPTVHGRQSSSSPRPRRSPCPHSPACQGELRPTVHSKSVPRRARFGLIPDEFFNSYTRAPRWSNGCFAATLWWPYPSSVVHARAETGPCGRLRGGAHPGRWWGVPAPGGPVLLPDHRVAKASAAPRARCVS